MKNRSDLDIISTILESADTKDGTQKTKIMFKAFVSTTQLRTYLSKLEKDRLITYDKKYRLYKTTNRGLRVIELYKKMSQLMPIIEMN